MRMLHTSDWHGGRAIWNQSRSPDLSAVIDEIIAIAREVKPDLIAHSGDLLDHSKVGHTEIERIVDGLTELSAIAPVVTVAGNHDSTALFRIFDLLHGGQRMRFVSQPLGGAGDFLTFACRDGSAVRVGALPFVNAHRSIDVYDDPKQWAGNYRGRVGALQRKISDGLLAGLDPRRELTVFIAHLFVTGAGISGSERCGHVSDEYATDADDVPRVSYAAFGHIHQPQALPGDVFGRYAGSPLALDFGEARDDKSVALVSLEPGKAGSAELIPLRAGRKLHTFDGTLTELQQRAAIIGDAICLLTVRTPTFDPVLSERVHDLLPRATVADITQIAADSALSAFVVEPGSHTSQPGILEQLSEYLHANPTAGASADLVLKKMAEYLSADDEDREPNFPEEELLGALSPGGRA